MGRVHAGRGRAHERAAHVRTHECHEQEQAMSPQDDEDTPIPFMQKLLDNPFVLLFLGVLVPMVLYNLWGIIDILTIPAAR
jgi:hypothetical protein